MKRIIEESQPAGYLAMVERIRELKQELASLTTERDELEQRLEEMTDERNSWVDGCTEEREKMFAENLALTKERDELNHMFELAAYDDGMDWDALKAENLALTRKEEVS